MPEPWQPGVADDGAVHVHLRETSDLSAGAVVAGQFARYEARIVKGSAISPEYTHRSVD
jgi:hypothetical protein